jgi:hypothetical protein
MAITGATPLAWLQSYITPLYEKDDPLDSGIYRPFSLSNVINTLWPSRLAILAAYYVEAAQLSAMHTKASIRTDLAPAASPT